eukprot:UN06559
MSMCQKLLMGNMSEWALLKRHKSEDIYGIQILTGHVDEMAMVCELINDNIECDFIDLNVGCPIDDVCNHGKGAGLMRSGSRRLRNLCRTMSTIANVPVTCKLRMGYAHSKPVALKWIGQMEPDGLSYVTLHGRSRQQRYRRPADWEYIKNVSEAPETAFPFIGNGDIYSWEEWYNRLKNTRCDTLMIGRGALIKPWLFQEIKEKRTIP